MIEAYLITAFAMSGVLFFTRKKAVIYTLVILFLIAQCSLAVYEYQHLNLEESGYFKADAFAVIFLSVLSLISLASAYHSYVFHTKRKGLVRNVAIYFSAWIMFIVAMSGVYLSSHIGLTWVFIELTTLCASALIYHNRNERSIEGTWKYIFVCSVSITLAFIGILFLSVAIQEAGSTDLYYAALLSHAPKLNPFWLKLAFIFIFTGYTCKAGLVPMFRAGVDAKDKAPSPASALFSSALMNVGFAGIFRFYEIIAQTKILPWANIIMLVAAVLSIFVAAVYMLKVNNVKRMLAYSSIEHMGIVMLGIVSGGIGAFGAILHLILHSFAKVSLFFQIGQVYRVYGSKSILDIGNYFKYNTAGAFVLILGFICVTGMPPSGMFISEFMIFRGVFQSHHVLILILVISLITMIIWAFGKNMFKMVFTTPADFDDRQVEKISSVESLSQFFFLALLVYLGLNPPPQLVSLIEEAIRNLPH